MRFFKRDGGRTDASPSADAFAWCHTTRCPKCSAPGRLEQIDLASATTSQHCPACEHRWQTSDPARPAVSA